MCIHYYYLNLVIYAEVNKNNQVEGSWSDIWSQYLRNKLFETKICQAADKNI